MCVPSRYFDREGGRSEREKSDDNRSDKHAEVLALNEHKRNRERGRVGKKERTRQQGMKAEIDVPL